jgi:hypothetical protein
LPWHIDAATAAATCELCHAETIYCTFERALELCTLSLRLCVLQALFSTTTGCFGTGLVNLLGVFRCVG